MGTLILPGGHGFTISGTHDIDANGGLDIGDALSLVEYIFRGGPTPLPGPFNADFSCDQSVDIGDITKLVDYIFSGGTLPCLGQPGL